MQMPCWHSRNSSSDLFWPGLMSTPQAPVQPRPYKHAQCHTCLVNSYHPSQDPSHLPRIEQPKGQEPSRADAPHPLHPASEPVLRTSPQSLLLPAPGQLQDSSTSQSPTPVPAFPHPRASCCFLICKQTASHSSGGTAYNGMKTTLA